ASGSFTGLANSTYNVQIRDAANTACVIVLDGALVITQPDVLSATLGSTNVTCNGANDGTISITSQVVGMVHMNTVLMVALTGLLVEVLPVLQTQLIMFKS